MIVQDRRRETYHAAINAGLSDDAAWLVSMWNGRMAPEIDRAELGDHLMMADSFRSLPIYERPRRTEIILDGERIDPGRIVFDPTVRLVTERLCAEHSIWVALWVANGPMSRFTSGHRYRLEFNFQDRADIDALALTMAGYRKVNGDWNVLACEWSDR